MQPGAIALNASDSKFMYYKSGTLKSCNSTAINHAMVIVGYHDGTSSRKVRNCKVEDWWVSCTEETEEHWEGADA